jgi:hypothetical protein
LAFRAAFLATLALSLAATLLAPDVGGGGPGSILCEVPVATIDLEGALDFVTLSPETLNLGSNETYTITLSDSTFIDMFVEGDTIEEPFVATGTSQRIDPGPPPPTSGASNVAAKERAKVARKAARKANR